jgi:hypothetical protein
MSLHFSYVAVWLARRLRIAEGAQLVTLSVVDNIEKPDILHIHPVSSDGLHNELPSLLRSDCHYLTLASRPFWERQLKEVHSIIDNVAPKHACVAFGTEVRV